MRFHKVSHLEPLQCFEKIKHPGPAKKEFMGSMLKFMKNIYIYIYIYIFYIYLFIYIVRKKHLAINAFTGSMLKFVNYIYIYIYLYYILVIFS